MKKTKLSLKHYDVRPIIGSLSEHDGDLWKEGGDA